MINYVDLENLYVIWCDRCCHFVFTDKWQLGKYICCECGSICSNSIKSQLKSEDAIKIYNKYQELKDAGAIEPKVSDESEFTRVLKEEFGGNT